MSTVCLTLLDKCIAAPYAFFVGSRRTRTLCIHERCEAIVPDTRMSTSESPPSVASRAMLETCFLFTTACWPCVMYKGLAASKPTSCESVRELGDIEWYDVSWDRSIVTGSMVYREMNVSFATVNGMDTTSVQSLLTHISVCVSVKISPSRPIQLSVCTVNAGKLGSLAKNIRFSIHICWISCDSMYPPPSIGS